MMQYAMKALTATKTTPVTQKVTSMVKSIVLQFDARGVRYQGLTTWNSTDPTIRMISAIANTIYLSASLTFPTR